MPFAVIGFKGWARKETLIEKARSLFESFGTAHAPTTLILQLNPPGFGVAGWNRLEADDQVFDGLVFDHDNRWRVLAVAWSLATVAAHRMLALPPNWDGYFA